MVQIIEENKRPSFSQSILGGLSDAIPGAIEKYQNRTALSKQGIDPNLPSEFGQMAYQAKLNKQQRLDELQFQRDLANQNADARKKISGISNPNPVKEPIKEPNQINKSNTKATKNLEKEDTKRFEKQPVFTPEEVEQRGLMIGQQLRDAGHTQISDEEAINEVNSKNEANKSHNLYIENEDEKKRSKQLAYGTYGVEKIKRFSPEAVPEVEEYFQNKGERLATSGKSEAEISEELTNEAQRISDDIDSIEKSSGPRRTLNSIGRKFKGSDLSQKKIEEDIKTKIKPLLDKGLNAQVRLSLAKIGYEIEEIENLVSNLGEPSKREVASFPKIEKLPNPAHSKTSDELYTEEDKNLIKHSVFKALHDEPSSNFILLRKAYEDKNVDWEQFKEALDNAIVLGKIKMTPDQKNQYKHLSEPPLGPLDKLLESMNFIGR